MSIYDQLIENGVKPLPEGMWFEFRESGGSGLRILVVEKGETTSWLDRLFGKETTRILRSIDVDRWDLNDSNVVRMCRDLSEYTHRDIARKLFIDKYKGKHGA